MSSRKCAPLALLMVAALLLPIPSITGEPGARAISTSVLVLDSTGSPVTGAPVGEQLTVNASIATTDNVTGANITLYIDNSSLGAPVKADLNNTTSLNASWSWNTSGFAYGDHTLAVNVSNATGFYANTTRLFTLRAADIGLDSISADRSNCTLGKDIVNVTAVVRNRGNLNASSTVEFLLDGSSLLLTKVLNLSYAGGGNDTASLVCPTDFAGASAGNHTVMCRLAQNHSRALSTGNITVVGVADVVLLSATTDRTQILPGGNLSITANLQNRGTGASSGLNVRFHLDNASLPTATLAAPDMGPGVLDSVVYRWTSTGASSGSHFFVVRRGPSSVVTQNFTVVEQAAMISVENLTLTPAAIQQGGGLVMVNATIRNLGPGDARGLSVVMLAGFTPVRNEYLNLSSGASLNWSYSWNVPGSYAPGNYTIHLSAGNGTASAILTIQSTVVPAALEIDAFSASPKDPTPGMVVTMKALVRNPGPVVLNETVQFFLNGRPLENRTVSLLPNGTATVQVNVTINSSLTGNISYMVRAGTKERVLNATVQLPFTGVTILGFTAEPRRFENVSATVYKTTTLRVVLRNAGSRDAVVNISIVDQSGGATIANQRVTIPTNETVSYTYSWRVRGTGTKTAVLILGGDGTGRAEATVTLTPAANDTCAGFLILPGAIMPGIIFAYRRRKGRGLSK